MIFQNKKFNKDCKNNQLLQKQNYFNKKNIQKNKQIKKEYFINQKINKKL